MRLFDDLKLVVKSALPPVLMGLLIFGIVGISTALLTSIEDRSSQIIEHADPALLLQAKANRQLQRLGYDVYRTLSYRTGTKEEDLALADFTKTARSVDGLFDEAAASYPARSSDFGALKRRFDVILQDVQTQ